MVTLFGKFLRNLRMDVGELLYDMAQKLDVSSSFLSAIENGNKKIPADLPNKIKEVYSLTKNQYEQLLNAYYETNGKIDIETKNLENSQKDLIFAFARKIDNLSESDMTKIKKILDKEKR